jgi:hypothetical protein
MSEEDLELLAEQENTIFMRMAASGKIYVLPGTPGATERHTVQHIRFTESEAYKNLPQPVKDVVTQHILDESQANPNSPNPQDMMKPDAAGAGGEPEPEGGPEQGGGGNAVAPGQPGGPSIDPGNMGEVVAGGDVTATPPGAPVA